MTAHPRSPLGPLSAIAGMPPSTSRGSGRRGISVLKDVLVLLIHVDRHRLSVCHGQVPRVVRGLHRRCRLLLPPPPPTPPGASFGPSGPRAGNAPGGSCGLSAPKGGRGGGVGCAQPDPLRVFRHPLQLEVKDRPVKCAVGQLGAAVETDVHLRPKGLLGVAPELRILVHRQTQLCRVAPDAHRGRLGRG